MSILLESYSALDRYFGVREPGSVHLLTDASLVSLAKIIDDLDYRGLPFEDACVVIDERRYTFRCVDSVEEISPHPFTAQHLIYNVASDSFLDPRGIYRDLRSKRLVEADKTITTWIAVMEAAKLVSRYHYEIELPFSDLTDDDFDPPIAMQRDLLVDILSSRYSEKGLSLLHRTGFIERFWPEIFEITSASHSKEYHPEGDGWEHTLETLRYRKTRNLTLSMALLLHDIGKPVSMKLKDKPFRDHAELGARISASLLRYLGFRSSFIKDVCFLVQYHMVPAALKKLPLYRTEKLMDSRLFPDLLELYRADISATFRGPESYYEACRVYKTYLKMKSNPYTVLKRQKRIL
jgi:poly(A) polymerase